MEPLLSAVHMGEDIFTQVHMYINSDDNWCHENFSNLKRGQTIFYPPYIFSKLSTDIALEESGWRTRHEAGSEAGLRIAPTSCGCPAQLGCCEKERGERTRRGEGAANRGISDCTCTCSSRSGGRDGTMTGLTKNLPKKRWHKTNPLLLLLVISRGEKQLSSSCVSLSIKRGWKSRRVLKNVDQLDEWKISKIDTLDELGYAMINNLDDQPRRPISTTNFDDRPRGWWR